MKRSLAILFVCALLISALTACGCSASPQNDAPQNNSAAQNSGDTQNGGGTQSDSGSQNDSAVIGGDSGATSGSDGAQGSLEQGADDIRDGIDNAVDDITGNNSSSGGVSYDQMLRNGRVKNGAFANDGTTSGMR